MSEYIDGVALGVDLHAEGLRIGIDPGYLPPLAKAELPALLAGGERDVSRLAAKLLEKTPARFRIDPGSVAAREREALRRDVEETANIFDSIRARVKAEQEARAAVTSPAERLGQAGPSFRRDV